MTRTIQVAGKSTGIPGSYQEALELVGGVKSGDFESGVVAILGECEGSIEPGQIFHPTESKLKKYLRKGPGYDASRFIFTPSREDRNLVRGASRELFVRVNPATQASGVLQNSTPADLLDGKSHAYGAYAMGLAHEVADGKDGAFGKKLILYKSGSPNEVFDNLGFLPAMLIRYAGNGTACTFYNSRTQFVMAVTGASDGSTSQVINISSYPTIKQMVDYINTLNGYEAVIVTPQPETFKCEDLDYIDSGSPVDIKTETGSGIDFGSTTATDFSAGSIAGLDQDDIIRIRKSGQDDEYLFTTGVGSPNDLIRGYLDSPAQEWSSADAVTFRGLTNVNQAIIKAVTNLSQWASFTRNTAYNPGVPQNVGKTYWSGASEGTTLLSHWQAALKLLRAEKVNHIVIVGAPETLDQDLINHMDYLWGIGGKEAEMHVAMSAGATLSQVKARAKKFQHNRIYLYFQEPTRENDAGIATKWAPWAAAAMAAGTRAGSALGTPLADKSLRVTKLEQHSGIDVSDDDITNELIDAGVTVARYDGDEFRWVRGLTTWTNDDHFANIDDGPIGCIAWTLYKVRREYRRKVIGKPGANASTGMSVLRATLEEIRDDDKAIVNGSKIVNGKREVIPAFQNLKVDVTGNVHELVYDITPVQAPLFSKHTTRIHEFLDASTS